MAVWPWVKKPFIPFAVMTLSSGTFEAQQPDTSRRGETHSVHGRRRTLL
jgi:hypothetical protein